MIKCGVVSACFRCPQVAIKNQLMQLWGVQMCSNIFIMRTRTTKSFSELLQSNHPLIPSFHPQYILKNTLLCLGSGNFFLLFLPLEKGIKRISVGCKSRRWTNGELQQQNLPSTCLTISCDKPEHTARCSWKTLLQIHTDREYSRYTGPFK